MKNYYVSVIDGNEYGLLLGPYKTHKEAKAMVQTGNDLACQVNERAWFYSYGTCKVEDHNKPGKLNHLIAKGIKAINWKDGTVTDKNGTRKKRIRRG